MIVNGKRVIAAAMLSVVTIATALSAIPVSDAIATDLPPTFRDKLSVDEYMARKLIFAAENGDIATIDAVLGGRSMLRLHAEKIGDPETVARLPPGSGEASVDINSTQTLFGGKTALHMAILSGQPVAARYLLNSGADMMKPDARGVTPLSMMLDRIDQYPEAGEISVNLQEASEHIYQVAHASPEPGGMSRLKYGK